MEIPASHVDILKAKFPALVATLESDGSPQLTPVWFDWDGTHLKFSVTTGRQKYRNLKREPRIAVTILDPANPYRYLELRGVVDSIDPDPDYAFIDSMAKKYLDKDQYPWHQPGDERVVVNVKPLKASSMG